MFWSSKALPWIIPAILMSLDNNDIGIIVSPWMENVRLHPCHVRGCSNLSGEKTLIEFLVWLNRTRNIRFKFYIRDDQLVPHIDYRLRDIVHVTREFSEYYLVPSLHAKFIATNSSVLVTSANLLTRSLYRNPETLNITVNQFSNSVTYVNDFFSRVGVRPRLWLDN